MHRRIAAATGIMMASVFLSRVLGLLRNWAVAHFAGASTATNAYVAAFTLPDFLNYLIAGGSLSITFIPVFAKYVSEDDEREGWRVFSTVITVMGIGLILLIAAGEILAGPIVDRVIAPGFRDPAERQLTIDLTRLMLPAQLFFYEGSILAAVQYAKHHFTIPALAPLIYNSSVILGGVLLFSKMGITGFSVGVVLGAILGNFLLQVFGAFRVGAKFTPNLRVTHPGFVLFLKLSVPIMLALGLTFADDWITRHYASYLGDAVTWLQYAKNLMQVPLGIVGQALGVASFPILAQLYSERKLGDLNRVLNASVRALVIALVPISALMMAQSEPLMRLFFTRTRLGSGDYQAMSAALVFYSLGLIAWGTQYILARGFYATRNTIVPAVVGTLTTFASLPLYVWLMHLMGFKGLALASSIGIGAYTVVLFVMLARRTENPDTWRVVGFFSKVAAASAVAGIACHRFAGWLETHLAWHRPLYAVLLLSVDTAVGVVIVYALLKAFRVREVDMYVRRGFNLVSRRP
jgi:putative peptidoglycan lipid II flippase